jgi:hypothetical protein
MKRVTARVTTTAVLGITALALLVVPGLAGATHSSGQGPKHDFAVGTGHFEGEFLPPFPSPPGLDIQMHVNAKSGPSGENATGRFYAHRESPSGLHVHGEVTCLTVLPTLTGGRAVVGGVITGGREPRAPFVEGAGIKIQVDDNGNGQVIPDRMHGDPSSAPPDCTPTEPTRLPVEEGNFTVHNALP